MRKTLTQLGYCVALLLASWTSAQAQLTLPYNEDFEGATAGTYVATTNPIPGLSGTGYQWDFEENTTNCRLRTDAGAGFYHSGNRAMTLDAEVSGTLGISYLTFTGDLSAYLGSNDLDLSFWWMEHGDEAQPEDRVWIRGSNTDAWIEVLDWSGNSSNGVYFNETGIDIDATLAANSQLVSSTFQVRFGWSDNFEATSITGSDGFTLDDFSITGTPPVPDNAGISALVAPTVPGTAGNQAVDVSLTNFGTNALNSVNIDWEMNGVMQTQVNYSTLVAPQASVTVNLGNYNFVNGLTTIRAWTSLPNGNADNFPGNDTLTAFFCTSLNGAYTVGGATADFTTIGDAVAALYNCGISGPVTLNIQPGTYTENIALVGPIIGASAVNTVTFDGGNAANTIVTHDGSGANGNATVALDGVEWVRIQNLGIQSTGTTDIWGVFFTNSANNNQILNNQITMPYQSGIVDAVAILASASYTSTFSEGDNANYNLIQGNYITGGDYAVRFEGASANRNVGNRFINNTITGVDDYGFYMDDQDSIEIIGNTVNDLRSTFSDAIYCFDLMNFRINSNNVHAQDYGIYVSDGNFDATPARRGEIINNMSIAEGFYCIYLDDVNETDVFHNSTWNKNTSTTSASFYGNDLIDVSAVNNIFTSDFGYTFRHADALALTDMDHNLFFRFNPGTNFIQFGTSNYVDVVTWQNSNTFGHGTNSVEADPVFFGPMDLHVDGAFANDAGDNTVGVTVDIDGESRPFTGATTVDIGADEFRPKDNDAGVIALVNPVSPLTAGFQAVTVRVRNFGVQDLTTFNIDWTYNGTPQGTIGYTGAPLAPQQEVDVTLSSINFPAGQNVDFVFWTSMPNGQTDDRMSNDTLYAELCQGLVGTYTVGTPTSDFPAITDAVDRLYQCGLAGAVTFQVAPGVYTGQQLALVGEISGASMSNTITFDGGDTATTFLTHDASNSQYATVLLDGADYVTVQNFNIATTAASGADGWGVHLINGADHNNIRNNYISATFQTSVFDVIPLVISGSYTNDLTEGNNANYTLIENNYITGGEKGIHLEGASAARNKYNRIINNTIVDFDDYGIYVDDQDSLEINYNTIETTVGSSFSDAIYCFDIMDFTINYNRVVTEDYGIYISDGNFDGAITRRGQIINNMVFSKSDDALYMDDIQYVDIWHNTLVGSGSTAASGLYMNDPTDLDIRNNIFVAENASAYAFESADALPLAAMDNNVFYKASGTNHIDYGTTTYDLATWQASGPYGYDANSLDIDPQFVANYTDLHVQNIQLNAAGALVGVATDIDGETRPSASTTLPDIGADEITIFTDDAVAVGVDAPSVGTCENANEVLVITLSNNGSNSISNVPVTVNLNGPNGTQTFSATYAGLLASAAQDTLTVGTFNTTGGGNYCFEIITQLAADGNASNDTANVCVSIANPNPTFMGDTTCVGNSASLTSMPAGGISWYDQATGGTLLSTDPVFTTPALQVSTTYYAEITSCAGGTTRTPVTATVVATANLDLGPDATICESNPIGLAAAPGAQGYLWSTGETTPGIIANMEGQYAVTMTDANGCILTDSIQISFFTGPTVSAQLSTLNCGRDGNGAVDITLAGGTAPFSFNWTTGATTEDITGLDVGTYTVTITDDNGCEFNETYPVNGPAPINFSFMANGVDCGNAGTLQLNVQGGTAPYTYNWSNGETTAALSNVLDGETYSVTVTDASGCTYNESYTISANPALTINVDNIVNESSDFAGSIDVSVSGGVGPYYIVWNTGDTTASINNLVSGQYEVTVYDQVGCSTSQTITVAYTQPTNINGVEGLNQLNLFPNPTQDVAQLQIELANEEEVQLTIYNLNGQEIQRFPSQLGRNLNYQINLADYSAGVYLARIIIGEQVLTERIILQK